MVIIPYDQLEKDQLSDAISWIDSGVEIFRIQKPDIPSKHLVSYFALIDRKIGKLLLIDHIKSKLSLLPGGHIEHNEDPKKTVEREIQEELGVKAYFISELPFFITITKTINTDAGHTDVSLWYLLKGDSTQELNYDKKEINGYRWYSYNEVLNLPENTTDPQMHRFIRKLLNSFA